MVRLSRSVAWWPRWKLPFKQERRRLLFRRRTGRTFLRLGGLRVIPVDTVDEVFCEVFAWVPESSRWIKRSLQRMTVAPAPEIFHRHPLLFACGRASIQDRLTIGELLSASLDWCFHVTFDKIMNDYNHESHWRC